AYVWQGKDNNCNTYLISNCLDQNRHLIIDPGHIKTKGTGEPALEMLLQGIQNDGLDPGAIGLILLTHCHPDHVEAAGFFQTRLNACVAIHRVEAEVYDRMGGKADLLLNEGQLKLGRQNPLTVDILHCPGHSPGHVALYWPKEKVLIAGDLIFYRSSGRTDLPGGDLSQMKQSIKRVSSLDIEWLLCGHPYGHPGLIEGRDEVRDNFRFLAQQMLIEA
ncbi:MAG: MBL fold metallo-hydrolase, partial [bacterium]